MLQEENTSKHKDKKIYKPTHLERSQVCLYTKKVHTQEPEEKHIFQIPIYEEKIIKMSLRLVRILSSCF